MMLDILTFYLLLTVGNFVMFGTLMVFAAFSRFEGALRVYAYAKLLHGLGMLLVVLRGVVPADISIILGNGLFFAGIFIEAFALIHVGKIPGKQSYPILVWSTIGLSAAFAAVHLTGAGDAARVLFNASVVCGTAVLIGVRLLTYNNDTKLKRFFGYFFLVMAVPHALRASDTLTNHTDNLLFGSYPAYVVVLLFSYIHVLSSTMAYLLMSREDVDIKLKLAATTDFLTGIFNRLQFTALAKKVFSLEIREGKPVAVLMFDLDNFKAINDTYGHPVGDKVLVHFSHTIGNIVRTEDIFARYGGEEFILLLPNTSLPEAEAIAERCQTALAQQSGAGIPVYTTSIGMAGVVPDNIGQLDSLIEQADKALLQAKQQGKNCIVKAI